MAPNPKYPQADGHDFDYAGSTGRPFEFDYLIVGAGLAGLVAAEQLCRSHGKHCLVVDKRNHIGGYCHDCKDEHGVLVHPYGPHYFRTNSDAVVAYLGQYTPWIPGNYRVLSYTRDRYWSFPVNLRTFEQYIGHSSSSGEMAAWLENHRETFASIRNSEQSVLSRFGRDFYSLFFEGYTLKQWQRHPSELAPSVCARIPIRTNRDDRYVSEKHQIMPAHGYTRLFENMVDACGKHLTLLLNTSAGEAMRITRWKRLIYTGAIDEFFDFRFSPLPYRSLSFAYEHHPAHELTGNVKKGVSPGFFQPVVQVNYPGPEPWTRMIESKHITGQTVAGTTLVREYPQPFREGSEPYYPVPSAESESLYSQYAALAGALDRVTFAGRLGTYTYLNMDQVIEKTLQVVTRLARADIA
jgi:UDP-galactopyranose mutase